MSDHTPTTADIRGIIAWRHAAYRDRLTVETFDRWLAEVRATALEEAADEFAARLPDGTGNGRAYNSHQVARMLCARAERIREEGRA